MSRCDSPIFIVGTPRSGTTLTAKILGRHSAVFMPGETHYFPDIYAKSNLIGDLDRAESREDLFQRLLNIYARYNEPEDQRRIDKLLSSDVLKQRLKEHLSDYKNAFDVFMTIQMESEGKERWGNNVPKDIFYIDEILEFYPDAKIVLCVRDIRGFLNSYKYKWKVTADDQAERLKSLYHPVITSLLWKSSMRLIPSIRKKIKQENLIIQRDEDLVTDFESSVKRLFDFIGEPFESSLLKVNYSNSSENKQTTGVYASSVEKWREKLSKEEVWISQKLAGAEMNSLGYDIEKTHANPVNILYLYITAPISLFIALRANRKNTGPILPYLLKRITSLLVKN